MMRQLARCSGELGGNVQGDERGRDDTIPVILIIVGRPASMSSSGAMPKLSCRDGCMARSNCLAKEGKFATRPANVKVCGLSAGIADVSASVCLPVKVNSDTGNPGSF